MEEVGDFRPLLCQCSPHLRVPHRSISDLAGSTPAITPAFLSGNAYILLYRMHYVVPSPLSAVTPVRVRMIIT